MKDILPILKDYFETELDQWEMFKMNTSYGMVYTTFARYPLDAKEEAYDLVVVEAEAEPAEEKLGKVFWRIGVEKPPTRGIRLNDFDSPVSALNHIQKWLKSGYIIRSASVMSKEEGES